MRLINTATRSLQYFIGNNIPPYAILSHTWGNDEVTLQDVEGGTAEQKAGYDKIRRCCQIAASDGFEYAWVDTCCIDKTSSAELTEAINSMYRWYQEAEVCYVYMSDVSFDEDPWQKSSSFRRSRWFTRGWTLQELIAPSSLLFFSKDWKQLGSKSSLQELVSNISHIQPEMLLGGTLSDASVAQRMSWAAERQTSRKEDEAYCLMGIFGVYMPMLYGEGAHAFKRLQEEILRITHDHSIFAWTVKLGFAAKDTYGRRGFLASSPADFHSSGNFVHQPLTSAADKPIVVSSHGIHLELPLVDYRPVAESFAHRRMQMKFIPLNCIDLRKPDHQIGIFVTYKDKSKSKNLFIRTNLHKVIELADARKRKPESFFAEPWMDIGLGNLIRGPWSTTYLIRQTRELQKLDIFLLEVWPQLDIRSKFAASLVPGLEIGIAQPLGYLNAGVFGGVRFANGEDGEFVVMLKQDRNNVIGMEIATHFHSVALQRLVDQLGVDVSRKNWEAKGDCFTWKLPGRMESISVVCRRQIIRGEKVFVIDIGLADSPLG